MDLIQIVRSFGGLKKDDPNIDLKAISAKEIGAKGNGSIFRKSQRLTLDEMREEILWEAGLNPYTPTDELFDMIYTEMETHVIELENKRYGIKPEPIIDENFGDTKENIKDYQEIESKIERLQSWLDNIVLLTWDREIERLK